MAGFLEIWDGVGTLALLVTLIFLIRYTRHTGGLLEQAREQTENAKRQLEILEADRQPILVLLYDPEYPWEANPAYRGAMVIKNVGGGIALDVSIEGIKVEDDKVQVVSAGKHSVIWRTAKRKGPDAKPGDRVRLTYRGIGKKPKTFIWVYDPATKDCFVPESE